MNLSLVLFADGDAPEEVERARDLLRRATGHAVGKVDKYFGTKLPPVCARLGCYLTDDGQRFYCVNSSCQKHRKRATKHTKTRRARTRQEIFFRCPRCSSRHVDTDPFSGEYRCRTCDELWSPASEEAASGKDAT